MAETLLQGRRVLLAEDEYILAEEMRQSLEEAGATVLGPVSSVGDAVALLHDESAMDGAVLDLNLNGEMIFPAADALTARGVPFVFTTGYEQWIMPERYAHVPRCEKPVEPDEVMRVLSREIAH